MSEATGSGEATEPTETTGTIGIVDGRPFIDQARELIIEYSTWLGRDLCFQNFDAELADPGKKYTPPAGELLVAVDESGTVLGMIAYTRHSDARCEMKRLYVRPAGRGHRLGERLIAELVAHARAAGFAEMVLDTVAPLRAAIHLYEKFGFTDCEPYYDNPMDDVRYMRLEL